MPCGIDIIHPEYQEKLYNEILKNNGLIISELEGNFLPISWTYARRNRIVAGLSKAILVVEAGLNSGTLITANCAKKYNRKIFAVPGQITSEVSKGAIKLIKE
jgi:DNA processing protein